MSVSEYFSDDDLEMQLRLQFDDEEQFDMDFRTVFNSIVDNGNDLYLEFRGRKFSIDKITGTVTDINPKEETEEGDDEDD